MNGKAVNPNQEVFLMCNNNFCGGNMCWIIILILLLCNCGGGTMFGGNGCGNNCGCDNNCGCC